MQDKIHYSRREASPSRLKYLFPLPPATLVFLSILILGVKESYKNIQSKSSVSGNVNFVFETNIFISHSNNSILSQNLRQGVEYQDRELDISESAKGSETMNDILQRYKDYLCGEYANKNTRKNKYSCVKNFLKFVDGVITKDNLLKWRQWANKHYKHNTLNISIQRINEFIEWYKKPELKKMKLIGFKDANKKALTENQFKALKQNTDDLETKLILLLLFDSILRPSEITNIKISNRQGDKLYLEDTKTGNNHIILTPELTNTWDDYISKERPKPKSEDKDFLLIQKSKQYKNERYHNSHPVTKKIKKLAIKSGINQNISSYTIRRTSITLRFDKDSEYFTGNPKLTQIMARHKDIKTTLKYDCISDGDIRKYHRNLNNLPNNLNDLHKKRNNLSENHDDLSY